MYMLVSDYKTVVTIYIYPSDFTRINLRAPKIRKYSGGACPQTPLAGAPPCVQQKHFYKPDHLVCHSSGPDHTVLQHRPGGKVTDVTLEDTNAAIMVMEEGTLSFLDVHIDRLRSQKISLHQKPKHFATSPAGSIDLSTTHVGSVTFQSLEKSTICLHLI